MAASEKEVHITAFLSEHSEFSGVVKHRFSDFIVHEVRLDGSIVKLDNLEKPHEYVETLPSAEEARSKLESVLPPEDFAKVRDLVDGTGEKEVRLTASSDKMARKSLHESLKSFRNVVAETENLADGTRQIVVRRVGGGKGGADSGTSRKRRRTETSADSYTAFVLYKENIDTTEAIAKMGEVLRLPPKRFFFAGTKDKRAVTSQDITVKGAAPMRLWHVSRALQKSQITLGNFREGVKEPLLLGKLGGNRFTIFLRDVSAGATVENVEKAVASLKDRGFINYFGLQRFGGGSNATHRIGLELIRGNFKDAVKLILEPLDPTRGKANASMHERRIQTTRTLNDFLSEKISASRALQRLPPWMKIERGILRSYAADGGKNDHKRAFGALPHTMKLMYIHAVQSFIFNAMATTRVQTGGLASAEEGDLVLADDGHQDTAPATAPETVPGTAPDTAPETAPGTAPDAATPTATADAASGPKDADDDEVAAVDEAPTEDDGATNARVVTKEEADLGSVPITRVVLPLIGERVGPPPGKAGVEARRIMEEFGIDLMTILEKSLGFRVYGSYRKLIAKPTDVDWKLLNYAHDHEDVLVTDKQELAGKREADGAGTKRGLKVEFTLEPAEYATMLLRELTKQDSSALAQSMLHRRAVVADAVESKDVTVCCQVKPLQTPPAYRHVVRLARD